MAYEVTATRRRPMNFEEIAGQEFVSATLKASIETGRIAHAYLFAGPRGCGKTSTARILARALNCEKGPSPNPCGVCGNCAAIRSGSSLDVIEIDGASNTSVDGVRQIKDEVLFPPNTGRYKIYIVDEVHMLSNSAFNALLKTIEEPPPYVVFIFATTELHKVPATIKSRCQQFNFRLIPLGTIKRLLAEAAKDLNVMADDDALLWIAREATGSQRDAYTLFDQVVSFSDGHVTAEKIRDKLGLVGLDRLNAIFEAGVAGNRAVALSALDELLERGVAIEQCVCDSVEYCRSLLLIKNGILNESIVGDDPARFSKAVLEGFKAAQIERALAGFLDLHRDIRYSVNPRYELELFVARLCSLKDWIAPEELACAVEGLRKAVASGALVSPEGSAKRPEAAGKDASAAVSPKGPPEGAVQDDIVEDPRVLRDSVITSIQSSNIILAKCLAKSTNWEFAEGSLVIGLPGDYEVSLARQESEVIAGKVCALSGRALRIEFRVDAAPTAGTDPGAHEETTVVEEEDPVLLVERAFRGKRVATRENAPVSGSASTTGTAPDARVAKIPPK